MDGIADWLGDADRIAELGRRLRAASVPADRLVLYRRTLHPEILGRATAWAPGRPIEIFDREHGLEFSLGFRGSPLDQAMADGARRTIPRAEFDPAAWSWADPFRGFGLAALMVRPLRQTAALVAGTRRPQGFSEAEAALLDRLAAGLDEGRSRKKARSQ